MRGRLTLEVVEKSFQLLMQKLQILLNLINLKLIVAVPEGTIGSLSVMIAAGTDGIVEEFVPVELLFILLCIFLKRYALMLRYAQFGADYLRQVRS